jgi:hypothetical protein
MSDEPPKTLKLARPAVLTGAFLMLIGLVVYRGWIPVEARALWTILLMVPGAGIVLFGLTITMAGRILAAAKAIPEDERPKWDDEED